MNEYFATTADVFRLTGELDPEHDQHPAADGDDKSPAASCRRIARMIGMDARDAEVPAWAGFAEGWRDAMLTEVAANVARVIVQSGLPPSAPIVGAGCGMFLAHELARRSGRPFVAFHSVAGLHAEAGDTIHRWADTCAPSVAVALLLDRWR